MEATKDIADMPPNATAGYKAYVEKFGTPDFSFLAKLPYQLDFISPTNDDAFVATDEEVGAYLEECVAHDVRAAAFSFVSRFFKADGWFAYPNDGETVKPPKDDGESIFHEGVVYGDDGEAVGVLSTDYEDFLEAVAEVTTYSD